jgi:predicted ATPase
MTHISRLVLKNFRCFRELDLELRPVQVFFGPNGSGKSTVLMALAILRDSIGDPGLARAYLQRGPVYTFLSDHAIEKQIEIAVEVDGVRYGVTQMGEVAQSISVFGEYLHLPNGDAIDRPVGYAEIAVSEAGVSVPVRPPFVDSARSLLQAQWKNEQFNSAAKTVRSSVGNTTLFDCRRLPIEKLRMGGSHFTGISELSDNGENLWALLAELFLARDHDGRYIEIDRWMRKAFPEYNGIQMIPASSGHMWASFLQKHRTRKLQPFDVPDGYLQFIAVMTALFAKQKGEPASVLLDEPDLSLHPWAIRVLSEAMRSAALDWGVQVLVATHSPALIDEFDAEDLLAMEPVNDDGSKVTRLSDNPEWREILDAYTAGSLYMAEAIAPQSPPPVAVPPATVPPSVP